MAWNCTQRKAGREKVTRGAGGGGGGGQEAGEKTMSDTFGIQWQKVFLLREFSCGVDLGTLKKKVNKKPQLRRISPHRFDLFPLATTYFRTAHAVH